MGCSGFKFKFLAFFCMYLPVLFQLGNSLALSQWKFGVITSDVIKFFLMVFGEMIIDKWRWGQWHFGQSHQTMLSPWSTDATRLLRPPIYWPFSYLNTYWYVYNFWDRTSPLGKWTSRLGIAQNLRKKHVTATYIRLTMEIKLLTCNENWIKLSARKYAIPEIWNTNNPISNTNFSNIMSKH